MDEFFFNLLLLLAEIIGELVVELSTEAIVTLGLRAIKKVSVDRDRSILYSRDSASCCWVGRQVV